MSKSLDYESPGVVLVEIELEQCLAASYPGDGLGFGDDWPGFEENGMDDEWSFE